MSILERFKPDEQQDNSRTQYLFEHHRKLSKHKGDYNFLIADDLSGRGDFSETDWGNERR